jgi:hypothetical protein
LKFCGNPPFTDKLPGDVIREALAKIEPNWQ